MTAWSWLARVKTLNGAWLSLWEEPSKDLNVWMNHAFSMLNIYCSRQKQFIFRTICFYWIETTIRKFQCAKFLQTRPMLTNEVNGPKMQKSMTFYEAGKFKTIFTTLSKSTSRARMKVEIKRPCYICLESCRCLFSSTQIVFVSNFRERIFHGD